MKESREERLDSLKKLLKDALKKGEITVELCKVVRWHRDDCRSMGINPYDVEELFELKEKLAFCPDPRSYSIQEPGRVNYIYKNLDNPDIELSGVNEKRFAEALSFYYSLEAEYKRRVSTLADVVSDKYNRKIKEVHDSIVKDNAADLFTGILFKKESPPITEVNFYSLQLLFNKYDLHDVYNMADNKTLLEWKAAVGAESAGWLDEGFAEVLFIDAGIDTDELENRITRYKIDKLRISKAELFTPFMGADTYIRCRVDGKEQKERKLSVADVKGQDPFVNVTGLAVKYFQKVLDRNRNENKAVADEKALTRNSMGTIERLVDIFHHGLSREDGILLKLSQDDNIDNFWRDTGLLWIGDEPVENQKWCAFKKLGEHLVDLRPGMLSEKEIIQLSLLPQYVNTVEREPEITLMKIPETFFPLIEQSQEWKNDTDVLNYVKVMRGIGRVTPEMAYRSMDYFLKNHLDTEREHVDEEQEDKHSQTVGVCDTSNLNRKNPAGKFPPNLLSEEQWAELGKREYGKDVSFIPHGAFRKDRVTEVQVYPYRDGSMCMRCKVDGEQQESRLLSEADAQKYDDKMDKRELATGYYMDVFARESERSVAIAR